jgi:hypothetical protein
MSDIIHAHVYSYKNKNLDQVVQSLIDNTQNSLRITVTEQHPITKKQKFEAMGNIGYDHIFWDYQVGPTVYKNDAIQTRGETYQLLITDDIIVSKNWDVDAIHLVEERNIVLSGKGKAKLFKEDKYFLKNMPEYSGLFEESQYIDRNFVFSKRSILKSAKYPTNVKYLGEEELYSINLFTAGIDIWSAPTDFYEDLGARTLENLYVPFSIEHNYNDFIDIFNGKIELDGVRSVKDFIAYHNLQEIDLKPLFYPNNDVPYDYSKMKMQDVGGERFIDNLKAIY